MFQKRLPAILSSFTKTLAQLDALEKSNKAAVEANEVKISQLTDENAGLYNEASQANKIAGNIRAILGQ